MAQPLTANAEGAFPDRTQTKSALQTTPAYQAYQILHVAFIVAPILAGLDKFFHLLTNWDKYLAPAVITYSLFLM